MMEAQIIYTDSLRLASTATLKNISSGLSGEYFFLANSNLNIIPGASAARRFVQVAEDSGADMVYADAFGHPLIDCQEGALRDDFDFGQLILFRTSSFRAATEKLSDDLNWAALYALRLSLENIVHINEPLYSAEEADTRKSGEKQFDYVDPRNRQVQIEMETVCTEHLKRIGAYLPPVFRDVDLKENADGPLVSVIIPVFNRVKTIGDAVRSALSQKCDFPFNVIVVDNHSSDGTTELLAEKAAEDSRLIHLQPQRNDLGIGGCWNYAVDSEYCGTYAVQLDSDDVYSSGDTLSKIVDTFRSQKCAMVIGSYMMTDFQMNPIPPGVIDHREWTDENGRNNALRINGLGAPRAFYVPVLRQIGLPNTSYGEDYALGLRLSREYRIGRIWDVIYNCRRWDGNSDAALSIEKQNRNNLYKDRLRTWELQARKKMMK